MADDKIEELKNVTMQQAVGYKSKMPAVAPDGQLLIARTPGEDSELWVGTGTGVEQLGGTGKGSLTNYVSSCKLNADGTAELLVSGSQYMKYNVNIVGTLTKNQATLSGFSADNYVELGFGATVDTSRAWSIILETTTGAVGTSEAPGAAQRLVAGHEAFKHIKLGINNTGHFQWYLSTNGETWDLQNGTTHPSVDAILANTHYFIRMSWDTTKYNLDVTTEDTITDSTVWTTYMTIESQDACVCTDNLIFGRNTIGDTDVQPYLGTLKLDKSSATFAGVKVWEGVYETTLEFFDYIVVNNSILSFNVTSTSKLEYVSLDGKTSSINLIKSINCSTFPNNTYDLICYNNGRIDITKLRRAMSAPANPVEGDYWLNTAKPANTYNKYVNGAWKIIDERICYIGSFVVTNGAITSLAQPELGRNYYNALEKNVMLNKGPSIYPTANTEHLPRLHFVDLNHDMTTDVPAGVEYWPGQLHIDDKNYRLYSYFQTHVMNGEVWTELGSRNNNNQYNWFSVGIKADGTRLFSYPQIVQYYVNGASWYRLWSDGWLEQGGYCPGGVVTLLKAYRDTNYTISVIIYGSYTYSGQVAHTMLSSGNRAVNTFYAYSEIANGPSGNHPYYYVTHGMSA